MIQAGVIHQWAILDFLNPVAQDQEIGPEVDVSNLMDTEEDKKPSAEDHVTVQFTRDFDFARIKTETTENWVRLKHDGSAKTFVGHV